MKVARHEGGPATFMGLVHRVRPISLRAGTVSTTPTRDSTVWPEVSASDPSPRVRKARILRTNFPPLFLRVRRNRCDRF